jgi:hypothetical protein
LTIPQRDNARRKGVRERTNVAPGAATPIRCGMARALLSSCAISTIGSGSTSPRSINQRSRCRTTASAWFRIRAGLAAHHHDCLKHAALPKLGIDPIPDLLRQV